MNFSNFIRVINLRNIQREEQEFPEQHKKVEIRHIFFIHEQGGI